MLIVSYYAIGPTSYRKIQEFVIIRIILYYVPLIVMGDLRHIGKTLQGINYV